VSRGPFETSNILRLDNANRRYRQLWEIDENLMRAELGPAEMAEHTAKRAEVVREKVELANLAKTKPDPSQNADKGQDVALLPRPND